MQIIVDVCYEPPRGWNIFQGEAPDGSDAECLDLPKESCRAEFWSNKLGLEIKPGIALIWRKL